jgi:hypothetical protein
MFLLLWKGRALLRNPRYRKLIDDITKEAQAVRIDLIISLSV